MKNKIITSVCSIFMFVPWTILILRKNSWALESPAAEIIIALYAVFMLLSGIVTFLLYSKAGIRNIFMKVCLVINGIYAVGGAAALFLMNV